VECGKPRVAHYSGRSRCCGEGALRCMYRLNAGGTQSPTLMLTLEHKLVRHLRTAPHHTLRMQTAAAWQTLAPLLKARRALVENYEDEARQIAAMVSKEEEENGHEVDWVPELFHVHDVEHRVNLVLAPLQALRTKRPR